MEVVITSRVVQIDIYDARSSQQPRTGDEAGPATSRRTHKQTNTEVVSGTSFEKLYVSAKNTGTLGNPSN